MHQKFYKKSITCLALASVFAMNGCQKDDFQASPALQATAVSNFNANHLIEGQYIVVFKSTVSSKTDAIIKSLVARGIIEEADGTDPLEGVVNGFVAKLTLRQVERLSTNEDVAYIEQDQVIAPMGTLATTDYTPLTGETVPQGVQMMGYADGTGKTAWIIDSGVDINNTDLNVDVTRSVSFLSTTTSVQDGYGHGTMIAGIIGAKNNGAGIIGVAANTKIIALRVMDNTGAGTASNAIKAVNHVGTYGKAGEVVNISLSAGASSTFDTAVKNVAAKGIFIAIAAGNSNADCSTTSPQRVNATNVYTVSAMDYNKYFWANSSWGQPVDRCAPGVNILSLAIGGGTKTGNGTSYAAPHVAGLLLLKGNNMGNIGYVTGDKDAYKDLIPHL